jgi:regulator of sirC expression with transglutaminase-like and TPR domain
MKNVSLSLFLFAILWQGTACADSLQSIRTILELPDNQIDLGKAKLVIDKLIDPTINIKANRKKIDSMLAEIKAMLPAYASNSDKLQALKTYLYSAGSWNGYQPYKYDFDDPLGLEVSHKLLPNYLVTKKGNCVSMPLLFIILGQRLGLGMTAAVAPMHIFVKLRDDLGNQINLEATSGANPARDVWIRQQIPMTDDAVANGVYLSPLSKKETVALMAETLIEYDMQQREYEKAIEASDLVLEYSPKAVDAMIHKGAAYARLIKEQFISQYPSPNLIPQEKRAYYEYLDRNNRLWYAKAEELGWREPTEANEAQYQQTVNRAKSVQ